MGTPTNSVLVGNDTTRALIEATLNDVITSYPAFGNDFGDADSDQSWKSAVGELHDIVGSLFTLAEPLNDVLEELQTRTTSAHPPLMESYKSFILDKFPDAEMELILRFAEGNAECHIQLRSQADELALLRLQDTQRPQITLIDRICQEPRYSGWGNCASKG